MKKTNQARERISPHLKKGEDSADPQKEGKMSTIEVNLKHYNVKSTGNFSTASNDDYQDIASANATAMKTAGTNIFAKVAKDANKTALEGHVQTM